MAVACDGGNTGNKDSEIDDDMEEEKTFAVEASYSNLAEIKMGELAQSKAASETVAQFAGTMVKEHTTALRELRAISEEQDIAIPDTLKMEHKRIQDEISALEGEAFDSAYMHQQVQAHQQAQQLFQNGINEDANPSFLNYARTTLEHINAHLVRAEEIVGAENTAGKDGRPATENDPVDKPE